MFIEPTIIWVPRHPGFSGYIWLDTKIVLKSIRKFPSKIMALSVAYLGALGPSSYGQEN